eukprot:6196885-Pleurochrysis_carterae.AAC.3
MPRAQPSSILPRAQRLPSLTRQRSKLCTVPLLGLVPPANMPRIETTRISLSEPLITNLRKAPGRARIRCKPSRHARLRPRTERLERRARDGCTCAVLEALCATTKTTQRGHNARA